MVEKSPEWTDEQKDLLRTLWPTTKTTDEIGMLCGKRTKRAAIGMAHRLMLGVKPKKKLVLKHPPKIKKRKRQCSPPDLMLVHPALPPKVKLLPPEPRDPSLPIIALTDMEIGMCRWPMGDPLEESFGYCGAAVGVLTAKERQKPCYCPFHKSKVVEPESPRNRLRLKKFSNYR